MDVLLIEDSPGDVRLAQEAFRASDKPIRLHVVGDGVEAMAFLRHEAPHENAPRPHLILLDLNLPKMDGRALLVKIKTDINLQSIPTIIFTSSVADNDVQYCYENAANCYLRKPTEWGAFISIVKAVNLLWFELAVLPAHGHASAKTDHPDPVQGLKLALVREFAPSSIRRRQPQ